MKRISVLIGILGLAVSILLLNFVSQSHAEGSTLEVKKVPVVGFTKEEPVKIESLTSEYIPKMEMQVEIVREGTFISETIVTFKMKGSMKQQDIDPLKFEVLKLNPMGAFAFENGEMIIDNGSGSVFKRTSNGTALQIVQGEAFLMHNK